MLPHKTGRGKVALERLKLFEGIPYPYSHKKRTVVPKALKSIRLLKTRKHCKLGELSTKVGWNKAELIERLEAKREERAQQYWDQK